MAKADNEKDFKKLMREIRQLASYVCVIDSEAYKRLSRINQLAATYLKANK